MYDVFLSLNVVLISADNADPGEMQRYAAFRLGIYCMQKYPFRSFQYTKDYKRIHSVKKAIGIINFTKRFLNLTSKAMIKYLYSNIGL